MTNTYGTRSVVGGISLVFVGLLLSACSTGIIQTDKDTYMVSEKAGGCGFTTAGGQES